MLQISNIVNLHDVTNIWHIPLLLRDQKAHESILKVLELQYAGKVPREPKLAEWTERATKFDNLKTPVGFISHYSSRVRGRVLPLMLLS